MSGSTPIFSIPHPTGSSKAYQLGSELTAMALGVEDALTRSPSVALHRGAARYRGAAQTIPQGSSYTVLTWANAIYAQNVTSSTAGFTVLETGIYDAQASFIITNSQALEVIARFRVAGSPIAYTEGRSAAIANGYQQVHLRSVLRMNANQTVDVACYQWSAGTISTLANVGSFSINFLSTA